MSKLIVRDPRVPIEVSVYAYPWYQHNDMNTSATPAVAFTTVLHNPLDAVVTTSFMLNLPIGIEPHTQRFQPQMSKFVPLRPDETESEGSHNAFNFNKRGDSRDGIKNQILSELSVNGEKDCFRSCGEEALCRSWSYDTVTRVCTMFSDVRMNGHLEGSFAGVKVHTCNHFKHCTVLLLKIWHEVICVSSKIKQTYMHCHN